MLLLLMLMLLVMMLVRLMKSLTTVGTFMIRESQEPGQQVISELLEFRHMSNDIAVISCIIPVTSVCTSVGLKVSTALRCNEASSAKQAIRLVTHTVIMP